MAGSSEFTEPGFAVLSHPRRLQILEALGERLREAPEEPAVGFSDLRRRIDMADSGNFNYHLDQLVGRFVRKTDEGYQLTAAGLKVVAAAISGVYEAGEPLGPTPIGDDCPVCGDELTASYDGGLVTVSCPDGHEFRNALPRGSVDERDLEGVLELLTLTTHQDMELASEGICPVCHAQLLWSGEPSLDDEFPHFSTQCSRCGAQLDVPIVAPLLAEPAVVAFYHEHGIDARRRPLWAPEFYNGVDVDVRSDPIRIDVAVTVDGEMLTGTLDGTLTVRDVEW